MTHEEGLALGGSILNFFGGCLLVIETFSPVREFIHKEGELRWEWLLGQLGKRSGTSTDSTAPPANHRADFEAAKRSQTLTRCGFLLVAAGFLLDLVAKLHIC